MKRFLFLTIACLFSICGMAQIVADTYVEVLYFHGKQRCVTCKPLRNIRKKWSMQIWQSWLKMVNYVSKSSISLPKARSWRRNIV